MAEEIRKNEINCWDYMQCGRVPGGANAAELGVCPAYSYDAGQACWLIAGTFCGGRVQGTFAQKLGSCLSCDFYKQVDLKDRATMRTRFEPLVFMTAVLDTVGALVVVLDPQGRILHFNRACEQTTGYTFDEVRGRHFWDLFLIPEEMSSVKAVFEALRSADFPNQHENHWLTKDGGRRLIAWTNTVLQDDDGSIAQIIATGIDITERRRATNALRESEAALRCSHEELQALTGRLISAKEEENSRLARELHDTISQQLAVLGMEVSAVQQLIASCCPPATEQLRSMGEEVGRLAQDVHRLSRQLHPSILDHLGLTATLRAECAAFSKQHGIAAELVADNVPDSLPGEIALSLYRIAQESLWNIAKHAQAHEVRIAASQADGELLLAVEDDGKGFDPDLVKGQGGLGLVSMEERIRLVNGTFSIRSRPGKGTRVEVRVPVPHPEG
ncbi:MAG: PAS domain S-box protein [Acidobacteria bacterium]|nr:PAS domain S-box protein [Acidobacteriota bacterium]